MRAGDDTGAVRRTILGVVAALGLVGALVVGVAAFTVDDESAVTRPEAVVGQVPTTVPPREPGTVTPAVGSPTTPAPATPAADAPAAEAPGTDASSGAGLAVRLAPRGSAIPVPPTPRPVPVAVQISSIDVSRFAVRAVGLEPDGQLEVPGADEIGWYRYGSAPGLAGTTVLAAHVSWEGKNGPFARLGSVEPGDQIEVTTDDGTVRRYVVVERALYGKLALPGDRLWRTAGDETLALITCGGEFNPELRRYRENIVVYAVPVG